MRDIHQLRDVQSWMESGIKLSTSSNEAAKLYDAAISQFIGWYDDKQLDGFETTLKKMIEADPEFIGARSLVYGLQIIGGSDIYSNPTLKENIEKLVADSETNPNCDKREKLHVKALQALSTSDADAAFTNFEKILVEYPSDVLSIHLAGLNCLRSGTLERIGGLSGRILPSFRDNHSLSTVYAWHSFGLTETNCYHQAERHARHAISLEPKNGWSTHALAHVFEMTSRCDEGISNMRENESLWNQSNLIAGHNYWHWALYHLTKGEFESAIHILEQNLVNGSGYEALSLSYLLSMEDLSIDDMLHKHDEQIGKIIEPYRAMRNRSFIDVHVMMGLCVSKKYDEAEQFMVESIGCETLHGKCVNENLLKAILSYSREKYDECVEFLWPIRSNIKQIGGSEAQRDVFNLMLINASLRSSKMEHKLLASQLIEEREIQRLESPLIDRLRNLL